MNSEQDRIVELANAALPRFGIGAEATVMLCNVSENHTYRVEDPATGSRFALRVHRPGYRDAQQIESELLWIDALREDGVVDTPPVVPAADGARVVSASAPGLPARNVVMFEWLDGVGPDLDDGRAASGQFEILGSISAQMHGHARRWARPAGFSRPDWDYDSTLGTRGHWGAWQDGLGIGAGGATAARAPRSDDRGAPASLRPGQRALRARPRRHPAREPADRRRACPGDRLRRLRLLLVHVRLCDRGLVHGGPPARARASRRMGSRLPHGRRAR